MPYPVNRSPGYGQLGRTIASRFFTGRFGKRDGSTVALSDVPFYRSTAPSSLSPPRTSSGRPHSRAEDGNCGKSSSVGRERGGIGGQAPPQLRHQQVGAGKDRSAELLVQLG